MYTLILYKPFFNEFKQLSKSDYENNHCIAIDSQIAARGDCVD